ncbi:MAG TPA: alpha-L-fucosidase C-terminal domain-containing protein [Opitutaceae bacterium]
MIKYDLLDQVGQAPRNGVAVKQVFFTKKPDALYAITVGWPGEKLVLRDVKFTNDVAVTMLGVAAPLETFRQGANVVITMPALGPEAAPCRHAYTVKLPGGEVIPEQK